jgi:DNA uptake protein ComE-like DNA-binding protein
MKLFTTFANIFGFNKSERRGIVALLGILACLMIGIQILSHGYSKPFDPPITEDISSNNSFNNPSQIGDSTESTSTLTDNNNNAQQGQSQVSSQQFQQTNIRERKPFTVQANTCDTLDLQQIRGIGSAFSKRIISYRERLGGFVRKEQLLEVWGIDSAKFVQIEAAFIIDKNNVRKLNINTATIRDLQNHPYLDYYQAKEIVQTRDKQGFYENVSDILKLSLMDRETFELIRDYLEL